LQGIENQVLFAFAREKFLQWLKAEKVSLRKIAVEI
jgi:hypothetical protein